MGFTVLAGTWRYYFHIETLLNAFTHSFLFINLQITNKTKIHGIINFIKYYSSEKQCLENAHLTGHKN